MPRCLAALLVLVAVASPGLCKPPDLPQYQNVIVLPHSSPDGEPQLLRSIGVLSNYPIQLLDVGGASVEVPVPEGYRPGPAQEPCGCPFGRMTGTQPVSYTPAARTVLENLELLTASADAMDAARRLAEEGKFDQAVERLRQACAAAAGTPCEGELRSMINVVVTEQTLKVCEAIRKEYVSADAPAAKETGNCRVEICCRSANQFGLCWMGQVMHWLAKPGVAVEIQVSVKDVKKQQKKARREAAKSTTSRVNSDAGDCGSITECPAGAPCGTQACVRQVPLVVVLEQFRQATGCEVTVDFGALRASGVSPMTPVSVAGDRTPMCGELEMMLRPHGLVLTAAGSGVRVTSVGGGCPACPKSEACACEAACPKCQAMHDKHAGKREMVKGLMKACRLAVADSRFEKAADLARQAHAVDAAAVEADPMVIRLDLLKQQQHIKTEPKHAPGTVGGAEEAEEGAVGRIKLVPSLPGVDPGLIEALDAVLRKSEKPRP